MDLYSCVVFDCLIGIVVFLEVSCVGEEVCCDGVFDGWEVGGVVGGWCDFYLFVEFSELVVDVMGMCEGVLLEEVFMRLDWGVVVVDLLILYI